MGQQQLLLLVLGAIIVGLAIVVGINLFSQNALKANEDAVRQDILTMMSRMEEFYRKPTMLGGGGKDWTNLDSFAQLGYKYNGDGTGVNGLTYTNDNGSYTLTGGAVPTIAGTLAEDTAITVTYSITINANSPTVIAEVTPAEE